MAMNRCIAFAEGEYYHIYNRGVEKRDIFSGPGDYLRFQRMLFFSNGTKPIVYKLLEQTAFTPEVRGEPLCAIGAYVLMPNHFHLLVRALNDKGITEFLRKLTTGYSMYFNKRYDRVGPLFQGTFKAEHVGHDEYLKYLFAYIHLNPIKLVEPAWKEKGIADQENAKRILDAYVFSSMSDWTAKKRPEAAILNPAVFPEYFDDAAQFEFYINEWLNFQGSTLEFGRSSEAV